MPNACDGRLDAAADGTKVHAKPRVGESIDGAFGRWRGKGVYAKLAHRRDRHTHVCDNPAAARFKGLDDAGSHGLLPYLTRGRDP